MTNARDLTKQLAELLHREHAAMADFLVALADFDRRRLWVELGHSSLFYFLHRELGLSAGAAQYRKTAAELIQRFPDVVEPLRDGRLCITSIVELAKVLTPENREDVLPRFFRVSRREAQSVAAAIKPAEAAPHREVVTAVRVPPTLALAVASHDEHATSAPLETASHSFQPVEMNSATPPIVAPRLAPAPAQRDSADPITAELSRLHVTVSRRFLEKLERAKDALSHSRPGASAEEILEAGLDLVLEQQAKRRGLVEKPRQVSRPAKTDRIPAQVRRAVWTRDDGRCQWPLDSGGICGSTLRLELDHAVPRARGGPSTIDNLRVLCRFHNDLAARRALGDAWMNHFTGSGAESAQATAASSGAP